MGRAAKQAHREGTNDGIFRLRTSRIKRCGVIATSKKGKYDKTLNKPPKELAVEAMDHLSSTRAADRGDWLKVGFALHHTDTGLLNAWIQFSKRSDKFREGECEKQWKGFKSSPASAVTVRTLVDWAMSDSGGAWPPEDEDESKPKRPPAPPPRQRPAPSPADLQYKATIAAAQTGVEKKVGERWPLVHTAVYPGDFHILRFRVDGSDKKETRPVHKNGQGWKIGDPPGKLPLYFANELTDAPFIVWLEGEPKTEAARALGFTATTTSHGAQSPHRTDVSLVAGKEILILNDNDDDGRAYAEKVAEMVTALDPPAKVKIVQLPGLPEHGDLVDYINERDSTDSADIRAQIMAIYDAAPYWTPKSAPSAIASEPVMVNMASVKRSRVEWLWPSRIALGKVTLIGGDPGTGKSNLSIDILSRVTTGTPWVDCPNETRAPAGGVLLTAEDDLEDTVGPRLDAGGADSSRVIALQAVMKTDPATGAKLKIPVSLTTDLPAIERAIEACKAAVVVIDPVSAYCGETDSHNNAEVRGMLAPLAELAARHRVAIICITHLNKGTGPAIYRAMGSLAFAAAARAVWGVMKDKETPSRRLLLPIKNNLGNDSTGLAYELRDSGNGHPCLAWEPEPITVTADDALDHEQSGEETSERDEVGKWLRELLAGDPVPAKEIEKQAKACGYSWATVRRAKKIIRAVAVKDGKGAWGWTIPGFAPGKGAQ